MKERKIRLLTQGERIDYEDLLLSIVGEALSKLPCLHTSKSGRDFFIADSDYEMIIRKKIKP